MQRIWDHTMHILLDKVTLTPYPTREESAPNVSDSINRLQQTISSSLQASRSAKTKGRENVQQNPPTSMIENSTLVDQLKLKETKLLFPP